MNLLQYDVIIIGGSIVGAALANLLAQTGLTIAVVEQRDLIASSITPHSEYALRVSAINWESQQILQQIGVWAEVQATRISPYHKMYVWDKSSKAHIQFSDEEIGQLELGYIIENTVMQQALLTKLQGARNIEFYSGVSLQQLKVEADKVTVVLSSGQSITANVLIGADGISSKVRELAGIGFDYKDYQHTAIIGTAHCEKPHQQTAWQCFLPDGVLAMLPLSDQHTCSIVWSCDKAVAERLIKLDELSFNMALHDIFNEHLGKIELQSERLSFPLAMRHAKYYVVPRVVLVGDAAHTIHPLAGQGLNLGLADAAYLAKVISETSQARRDIGLVANLRAYERWRKKENLAMICAMQGFKDVFGATSSVLIWLRGRGLNFVNNLPMLKNFFIRRAMGLNND